jgi:hypothetical protein
MELSTAPLLSRMRAGGSFSVITTSRERYFLPIKRVPDKKWGGQYSRCSATTCGSEYVRPRIFQLAEATAAQRAWPQRQAMQRKHRATTDAIENEVR